MTTWLFLTILVLLSGLVAYLGDLLGRHVGKRRIQIGEMRPKHTAVVVTTVTGGVITLITIGALYAASEGLRSTLLQIDEWNALTREREEARREYEQATLDYEETKREYERRFDEQEQQLQVLEDEIKSATERQQSAVRDREKSEAALVSTRSSLNEAQAEVEAANTAIAAASEEKTLLEEDVAALQQTVRTEGARVASLQGEVGALEDTLRKQTKEIDANDTYIREQESERDRLVSEQARLEEQVASFKTQVKALESEEIILEEGTTIGARYIATGGTVSEVFAQLEAIATEANTYLPNQVTYQWPSPEEYKQAVDRIRALPVGEAVAVMRATKNVVKGDRVPIRIDVGPSTVVFNAGDLIYALPLKQKLTTAEANTLLRDTVFAAVRKKALERGMIPDTEGYVFGFNATTLEALVADLVAALPGSRLELRATVAVKKVDYLNPHGNFEWVVIPPTARQE